MAAALASRFGALEGKLAAMERLATLIGRYDDLHRRLLALELLGDGTRPQASTRGLG